MQKKKEIRAMSLFAGGGIGETYLEDIGVKTLIANELLEKRAEIHRFRFPNCEVITGDIKENKETLINKAKELDINLLIATPPCQGMSSVGKRDYENDVRNYLIFDVLDIIDRCNFDYVLIENVPKFLGMKYMNKDNKLTLIADLFKERYADRYEIAADVYNAADYGVPQTRKRTIIRLWKKGLTWDEPEKVEHQVTLREAIGDLPSLESGESSNIKWHTAPKHPSHHVLCMKHTPTGMSAHKNPVYYPKNPDGTRIKTFKDCFKRMEWDKPANTRTMNNKGLSSSNNGHPGRPYIDKETGETLYSDARALTLLELFIVSSLPRDISFPDGTTDKVIRDIVGEGVPPKMMEAFIKKITQN